MFDYSKTLLNNKNKDPNQLNRTLNQDDTRSMRSEYDYENKKKFVDVLGHRKTKTGLLLDQQKDILDREYDRQSTRSKPLSIRSFKTINLEQKAKEIQEKQFEAIEEKVDEGKEEDIDKEYCCKECGKPLNEEDMQINIRFI